MSEYVILTDSSADLTDALVKELELEVLPLTFTMEGKNYHDYPDRREMPVKDLYAALRGGKLVTTSAVNVSEYTEMLEPLLQAGKDVLVLAFSSGLSTTYNSSRLAVEELREKYPERKLYTVDTLCASLGQGLLVWYAARMRQAGKTIEEVRDWTEANKLNLCHWFTVDDLHFLKRGGRISAATAVVGTMLQIKPVLHVDNEGHLINMAKARGRKASLTALVDHMAETAIDPEHQTIYISHGDCEADAEFVAGAWTRRFGIPREKIIFNEVGPVIGAHSGPGTLALFFVGKER